MAYLSLISEHCPDDAPSNMLNLPDNAACPVDLSPRVSSRFRKNSLLVRHHSFVVPPLTNKKLSEPLGTSTLVRETSFTSCKSDPADYNGDNPPSHPNVLSKSLTRNKLFPHHLSRQNTGLGASFNSTTTSSSRLSSSRLSESSDVCDENESFRYFKRKLSKRMSRKIKPTVEIRRQLTKEELYEKMLYGFRMVRFVARLHLALKNYSRSQNTDQTIDQLNYYSMETEFAAETLVFSKSHFAASNVVYMPAWARKVLVLSSDSRSKADIVRLATLVKKFFKKSFLEDNLRHLCKYCTYVRYEKKRVLIRSGHQPLYCYLLFSGSVFVNIQEQDETSGKKYYRTAAVLKRGTVFGEIGVIYKIPRTATIVCRENVECLLIPPEVCMKVFPEENGREFQSRLAHMRNADLFSDWPDDALNELCLVSKMTEHSYDQVIEKNTRDSEFIYMVVKGRVEIMAYVDISRDPYSSNEDYSKLQQAPPDHTFLPPMPVPRPSLLTGQSASAVQHKNNVLLSIDSLFPYNSCDMLSLLKTGKPNSLILVSRGAEVIRYPKLRLQTIPPLKCWKSITEKAKLAPRYPNNQILGRLCLEHCQWSCYKQLVLQDSLDRCSGRFQAMKAVTSKTVTQQLPSIKVIKDDEAFKRDNYTQCLEDEAPLHDIKRHRHKGPCLRSWNSLNHGSGGKKSLPSKTARSLSASS